MRQPKTIAEHFIDRMKPTGGNFEIEVTGGSMDGPWVFLRINPAHLSERGVLKIADLKAGIEADLASAVSPPKTTEDTAAIAIAPAHTPGPWTVPHFARDEVSCNCVYVLGEGYMGSICDVSVDNGIENIADGGNDAPPLEEAKCNARLIAAAPELLEALRECIDAGGYAIHGDTLSKARAAIEKAISHG